MAQFAAYNSAREELVRRGGQTHPYNLVDSEQKFKGLMWHIFYKFGHGNPIAFNFYVHRVRFICSTVYPTVNYQRAADQFYAELFQMGLTALHAYQVQTSNVRQ